MAKPDLRAQLAAIALSGPPDPMQTEIDPRALEHEAATFGALSRFSRQGRSQDEGEALDAPATLLAPLP